MFNADLSKLSIKTSVALFIILFGLTSFGSLLIFVFDRNLFLVLDWIKLIILSFGLMFPMYFIISYTIFLLSFKVVKDTAVSALFQESVCTGAVLSMFIACMALFPIFLSYNVAWLVFEIYVFLMLFYFIVGHAMPFFINRKKKIITIE